ncbi:MAG TPA: hypothetical protein ENJ26_01720 [Rhodobacteraceae bacterium]|nr:hypothetical protein [Paracoccaceae bacterium]
MIKKPDSGDNLRMHAPLVHSQTKQMDIDSGDDAWLHLTGFCPRAQEFADNPQYQKFVKIQSWFVNASVP